MLRYHMKLANKINKCKRTWKEKDQGKRSTLCIWRLETSVWMLKGLYCRLRRPIQWFPSPSSSLPSKCVYSKLLTVTSYLLPSTTGRFQYIWLCLWREVCPFFSIDLTLDGQCTSGRIIQAVGWDSRENICIRKKSIPIWREAPCR